MKILTTSIDTYVKKGGNLYCQGHSKSAMMKNSDRTYPQKIHYNLIVFISVTVVVKYLSFGEHDMSIVHNVAPECTRGEDTFCRWLCVEQRECAFPFPFVDKTFNVPVVETIQYCFWYFVKEADGELPVSILLYLLISFIVFAVMFHYSICTHRQRSEAMWATACS